MRAEAVVEVLVVVGAFRASEGGMERSRRIPWLYQRVVLVKPRDCPTYALDVSLRSALRLRSAHFSASAPLRMTRIVWLPRSSDFSSRRIFATFNLR